MEQETREMLDKANEFWAEYSELTPERLVESRGHYDMLSAEYIEMRQGLPEKKLEGEASKIFQHLGDLKAPGEFLRSAHKIFKIICDFDDYRSNLRAELYPAPEANSEDGFKVILSGSEASLVMTLKHILGPIRSRTEDSYQIEALSMREAEKITAAFVQEMTEAAALHKPRIAHLSEDKKHEAIDKIFQTSLDKIIAQLPEKFVSGILAAQLKINEAERQRQNATSHSAEKATVELLGKISKNAPASGRGVGGESSSKPSGEGN